MNDPRIVSVFAIALIIVVLALRMRRMRRKMPLNLKRLWVGPMILLALAGFTLAQFPPAPRDAIWLVLALCVGAALGWQRARLVDISINPDDKTLSMQASPLAVFFLIALVLLRGSLRAGLRFEGGLNPFLVNDIFIVFAVGLFIAQSVELGLRARRLLAKEQS